MSPSRRVRFESVSAGDSPNARPFWKLYFVSSSAGNPGQNRRREHPITPFPTGRDASTDNPGTSCQATFGNPSGTAKNTPLRMFLPKFRLPVLLFR